MMMDSGKNPPPRKRVQHGSGVSPRDEHTFPDPAIRVIPFDRDPMRGVFTGDSDNCRKSLGADLFEADQAYPGDCMVPDDLRPEVAR